MASNQESAGSLFNLLVPVLVWGAILAGLIWIVHDKNKAEEQARRQAIDPAETKITRPESEGVSQEEVHGLANKREVLLPPNAVDRDVESPRRIEKRFTKE